MTMIRVISRQIRPIVLVLLIPLQAVAAPEEPTPPPRAVDGADGANAVCVNGKRPYKYRPSGHCPLGGFWS